MAVRTTEPDLEQVQGHVLRKLLDDWPDPDQEGAGLLKRQRSFPHELEKRMPGHALPGRRTIFSEILSPTGVAADVGQSTASRERIFHLPTPWVADGNEMTERPRQLTLLKRAR
jgi:hypothetical protein